MPDPTAGAAVAEQFGLDEAILDRLALHVSLLQRWQPRINLVGTATLTDVWRRHVADSLQLLPLIEPLEPGPIVDLGSGAGFPGLVLAIAGRRQVHLIESDQRKCVFLREVSRETLATATIHAKRLEHVRDMRAGIVTARAFAPLDRLLDSVHHLVDRKTHFILHKGLYVEDELTRATKSWKMRIDRIGSQTDPSGTVLWLRDVHPRPGGGTIAPMNG